MIIKNKYTNMLVGIMGLLIISCENSTANDSVKPKKTETLELFNKATKEKPFFVTAPFLIIDGKKQFVSPEKYIAAKIKGIKSKYHQVGVPSTWNHDCYLVEVASGKILFSYTATDSYNLVSDLSKDNKYLAAPKRAATNIDLRAIPSGKVMRTLKGLNALPALVKFTKDTSKLIGYSRKGKLMIWEVESGKVLFEKETSRPKNISFMDDGKFKLTYFDGKASSFKLAQN